MDDLKSEITPRVSSATISASAAHNGHQACKELRPRRTSKVSVSIVILVFFAMAAHASPTLGQSSPHPALGGSEKSLQMS